MARRSLPLLLLLLSACAPKASAPVASATGQGIAVLALHDHLNDDGVEAAPAALTAALDAVARQYGLQVTPVSSVVGLDDRRTAAHRLEWLVAQAQGTDLLLLVQTQPRFYSQLGGQYRWTVQVEATVARASDPAQGETIQFDVPVFLTYDHEREADALSAAAPAIARRTGALLDAWLGGAATP
jgi:hypothetical protein